MEGLTNFLRGFCGKWEERGVGVLRGLLVVMEMGRRRSGELGALSCDELEARMSDAAEVDVVAEAAERWFIAASVEVENWEH